MFDCHVHGHRSFDSEADYKAMLDASIASSLDGIIITEHLDLIPGVITKARFDSGSYFSEIGSINKNHSGKILSGLELGLVDFSIRELNQLISAYPFDCIIGSVHYINGEDPYMPEYFSHRDKITAYSMCIEKYIELLPLYPQVNVLGHFDYVSRYTEKFADRNFYYRDYSDYFDILLPYIIKNNIALEINTSTYRKRGAWPENTFDTDILKRYREFGGELITLGSDAHSPSDVAYRFPEFLGVIKNAGFKYITHYEARKPVFEKL